MAAPSRISITALVHPMTSPQPISRTNSSEPIGRTDSTDSTTTLAAIEILSSMSAVSPVPPMTQTVYTRQNFNPLQCIQHLQSVIHTAHKVPFGRDYGCTAQYLFQDGSMIVRTSENTLLYICKLADTMEYAMLVQSENKIQYINHPSGVPVEYEYNSSFFRPYIPKTSKDDRLAKAASMMGVLRNIVNTTPHT